MQPAYGRGPHQREGVPYGSVSMEINRKIRDGKAPALHINADVRAFAKREYEAAGLSDLEVDSFSSFVFNENEGGGGGGRGGPRLVPGCSV